MGKIIGAFPKWGIINKAKKYSKNFPRCFHFSDLKTEIPKREIFFSRYHSAEFQRAENF